MRDGMGIAAGVKRADGCLDLVQGVRSVPASRPGGQLRRDENPKPAESPASMMSSVPFK